MHPSGASYAGWWERVAAEIIDGLLLTPFVVGIVLSVEGLATETLLIALVGLVYNGLLDGSERGQTVGKRVMHIRVVDVDTGESIGIGRGYGRAGVVALLQNANSVIPLAGLLGLVDSLWMLWDPQKQTWHDKAARSVVVKAE
jgi:uncharacterized RDD family membrane protein YckC